MTVFREKIFVETSGTRDMTDITHDVNDIVAASGIKQGICHIFHVGSTGAIGTIEFESGLATDFAEAISRLFPAGRHYMHEQRWHDGNGHSHLQAAFLGAEITVPVADGVLLCGVWQQIFHYEADIKPRRREIIITVIGE